MKRKNAPLEASNVAVLLEHIPVGQTRSVHSLQVTRVEPDHYSIGGGRVIDLVDAISQIGQYTGHGAQPMRSNPPTAWHLDTAVQYLDKSKQAEQAGDLWAAYDFATMGISEVTDVQQHTTKMWDGSRYVDQPLDKFTLAKANERLAPLLEQQRKLKAKLRPELQSNPKRQYYNKAALTVIQKQIDNLIKAGPSNANARREAQELYEHLLWMRQNMRPNDPDHGINNFMLRQLHEKLGVGADLGQSGPEMIEQSTILPRRERTAKLRQERMPLLEQRAAKERERRAKRDAETDAYFAQLEAARKARDLTENPQKAERGYFYEVMDKRGDVVMLTTTKAEAQDICANPAEYKLRKGGTFTFRHIGAQSALEGPPIKRI